MSRLDTFIGNVNRMIINPLIALLFALAVVFFLYGMLQFLAGGQNDEKRTQGKKHMLWGVIGMTIMMSVFFILNLALSTFGLDDDVNINTGGVELDDYNPTYPPP